VITVVAQALLAAVPIHSDPIPNHQPAPDQEPPRHGHLWSLPDGTGLHVPPGHLVHDQDTGRVCCHLCGRWFVSLGSHVRGHGYSADDYRAMAGLLRGRALVAPQLSAAIGQRQSRAYRRSPQVRERLAANQERARNGELAQLARSANAAGNDRLERSRGRAEQLAAGRATRSRQRHEQLASRLSASAASVLSDLLRAGYSGGASLDDLARATGLGRSRLRQEMTFAGITVRPAGRNTSAGKRSRARAAERAAAARVGTDDLTSWLAERRAAGWTLTQLAAEVEHSTHWVRWRLPGAVDR